MKNDTCIICGTKFDPRESKMYCSESCKQKAHYIKKTKGDQKESELLKPKKEICYRFDLSTWEEVSKHFVDLTLEEYAFITKSLTGAPDTEFIVSFINAFISPYKGSDDSFLEELKDKSTIKGKQFEIFLEQLHGGNIEFFYSNEKPKIPVNE